MNDRNTRAVIDSTGYPPEEAIAKLRDAESTGTKMCIVPVRETPKSVPTEWRVMSEDAYAAEFSNRYGFEPGNPNNTTETRKQIAMSNNNNANLSDTEALAIAAAHTGATKANPLTDEVRQAIEQAVSRVANGRTSDIPAALRSRTVASNNGGMPPDVLDTPEGRQAVSTAEVRKFISGGGDSSMTVAPESRSLSTLVAASGGNLVADDRTFYGQIVKSMKRFVNPEEVGRVFVTDGGNPLPIPTNDDTSNTASSTQENYDQGTATDLSFGLITLGAKLATSGIERVSNSLLEDAPFAEAFIADRLGERVGRLLATWFTTGTGTAGQPQGIVTGSTLGKTAASATAITLNELIDLQHSLDPAYRSNGTWMFHDTTLAALRKVTDSQGRPLLEPSYQAGAPSLLLGRPYIVNNAMPQMTTGQKSIIFADLSRYYIRIVRGINVVRTSERYFEYGQTGFLAGVRVDAAVVDSAAVRHLVQA